MNVPVPGRPAGRGSRALPTVPAGSDRTPVALFDVDPDVISTRVLACPAVAGLSAGPYGLAVTYLPGRRVAGVRLSPTAVEVHLVARYGPSVAELAGQVRAALAGHVGGRQVDLVVEDLAEPGSDAPAPAVPAATPPAAPVTSPPLAPVAPGTADPDRGSPAAAPATTPAAARPVDALGAGSAVVAKRSTRLFRRPWL